MVLHVSEPVSSQDLVGMDLSRLHSPLMPPEVRTRTGTVCQLIESLVRLNDAKETAFMEATDTIQLATKHILEAARLQEEQLLSDLWIQHERNMDQLARGQNQVSDRIQAIVRLIDSADTPAMEWSLPSRSENTELVVNRLHDLEQLVLKVQAECSTVVTYRPQVSNLTLGSLQQCAVSQYKSPVVPGDPSHIYQSNVPKRPHKDIKRNNSNRRQPPEPRPADVESAADNSEQERFHSRKIPRISPESTPRRRKIHRSLSVQARRTLPLVLQHHVHIGPVNIYPSFMFKLDSMGREAGQLRQPTDAALLPNGNILVADYNNRRLQEFNQVGQSVQMFTYPRIKPKALTMTRDNFIALIDGIDRNIKTYTRGAELVCRFGTGYFRDPCAIATTAHDQYVMIDTHAELQKTVFIYDPMTGSRTVMGFVNGSYIFSNPEGVAVTKDDHILVTDAGHHCVFLFTSKGKLVDRFGREGQAPGDFWYPKGICVDRYNNFLVADCGNHRVSLFSQNGKYLCNVLDSHHGLHFPLNICISTEDVLVVVQNAEIHVYHIPRSQPLKDDQAKVSTTSSLPVLGSQDDGQTGRTPDEATVTEVQRRSRDRTRVRSASITSSRDVDMARTSAPVRLSVLRTSVRVTSSDDDMDNTLEEGMFI